MSKKHFIAFAAYAKDFVLLYKLHDDIKWLHRAVAVYAAVGACQDNPYFNRERFRTACDLTDELIQLAQEDIRTGIKA